MGRGKATRWSKTSRQAGVGRVMKKGGGRAAVASSCVIVSTFYHPTFAQSNTDGIMLTEGLCYGYVKMNYMSAGTTVWSLLRGVGNDVPGNFWLSGL